MAHHPRMACRSNFFIARARACAYISVITLLLSAFSLQAKEPTLVRDAGGNLQEISLSAESKTIGRTKFALRGDCKEIVPAGGVVPLRVSPGATLATRFSSSRGMVVLDGVTAQGGRRHFQTRLLGASGNLPLSVGSTKKSEKDKTSMIARLTLAAAAAGQGDLLIQQGESITVKTDDQLFTYRLPALRLPSEGALEFYPGSDDRLYWDAQLTHPLHAGACRSKKK